MTAEDLSARYRAYIDCLNRQDWRERGAFVHEEAEHNDRVLGIAGYREMLEADVRAIPDLRFEIRLLLAQPPFVASRLTFDFTPVGDVFGMPVNGRRVRFDENMFYEFEDGTIRRVWSVIDTAAIAARV